MRKRAKPDGVALIILTGIWLLFFWRLLTPIDADQASIKKGDFSGQFVAFAAYQYQRFEGGEVPLWNPYNNGGLPFIGDTQAAVFYPPRLITIGLSKLAGSWTYHALELEMTLHVLACSFFMYLLIRRMTLGQPGSIFGAFIASVIFSYGGFMQSYPPLQLALLEAAIWIPLAMLGIYEATRGNRLNWRWLLLTGFAFGLSWMAGHPQTSWFSTYLLTAYLIYRGYQRNYTWHAIAGGILAFGILGGALACVQLLPGLEYLAHTSRTELGFEAKGNGFPIQDIIQFIFTNIVSQWSPLYVGIIGLVLVSIAVWRRLPESVFWIIIALVVLGLSFGKNSPVYAFLYNILPGLRFFRGQERGAFVIAFSLALLAGLGAAHLVGWDKLGDFKSTRRIQQALTGLIMLCSIVLAFVILAWLGNHDAYGPYIQPIAISVLLAVFTLVSITWLLNAPYNVIQQSLVGLVLIVDLFSLSMDNRFNYDPLPPQNQLQIQPPPLAAAALADDNIPFRVDGYRVLNDNYGSLYNIADMRGISPLFLDGPNRIINRDLVNPTAWELFAVRYVYTDWEEIPVPSTIMASGEDRYGKVNMHRLTDPRPFATLIHNIRMASSDSEALTIVKDGNVDLRHTVILEQQPDIPLHEDGLTGSTTTVTEFKPESFAIITNSPTNAILSVAHPYYPGWVATIDGQPATILRAYGALTAIAVPVGSHLVEFQYDPLSYKVSGVISVLAWFSLVAFTVISIVRRQNNG